jgi:hypothetical protein
MTEIKSFYATVLPSLSRISSLTSTLSSCLILKVAEKEKTKVENSTTPQFGLTKAVVKSVVPDRGVRVIVYQSDDCLPLTLFPHIQHDLKSSEIKNASVLDRGYV